MLWNKFVQIFQDSTGQISYKSIYDAFTALTDGATVTWDCTTGLNKTLTTSRNEITLSISNVSNGMNGKLIIYTTLNITIHLPTGYFGIIGVYGSPLDIVTAISPTTLTADPITGYKGVYIEWNYDGTRYIYKVGSLDDGTKVA